MIDNNKRNAIDNLSAEDINKLSIDTVTQAIKMHKLLITQLTTSKLFEAVDYLDDKDIVKLIEDNFNNININDYRELRNIVRITNNLEFIGTLNKKQYNEIFDYTIKHSNNHSKLLLFIINHNMVMPNEDLYIVNIDKDEFKDITNEEEFNKELEGHLNYFPNNKKIREAQKKYCIKNAKEYNLFN